MARILALEHGENKEALTPTIIRIGNIFSCDAPEDTPGFIINAEGRGMHASPARVVHVAPSQSCDAPGCFYNVFNLYQQ